MTSGQSWQVVPHADSLGPDFRTSLFAVMCPEDVCTLLLAMVFFGVVQSLQLKELSELETGS